MAVKLGEDERIFFEHLIEFHRDDEYHLAEYGIMEDDLRVIRMKTEYQEQDIDVDKVVESLVGKDILEREVVERKSGGLSRDEDETLHRTATEEAEKYVIVNAHILEEIQDRIK